MKSARPKLTTLDDLKGLSQEDIALATKLANAQYMSEWNVTAKAFSRMSALARKCRICSAYDLIVAARKAGLVIEEQS